MWGTLLWIAADIVLTQLIDPRAALALSTAACLGAGVAASCGPVTPAPGSAP